MLQHPRVRWLAAGLALVLLAGTALVRGDIAQRREAFATDARIAHRLLSQRAVEVEAVLATVALLDVPAATRLPALHSAILRVGREERADAGAAAGPPRLDATALVLASRAKAYPSASARNATLAMMEAEQKNPAAANLVDIPGFLLLGGGVPIRVGKEVVGAVGVGVAPCGHLDEQCAMAALEQVKEQRK
jgi:uncharacterized protein GlcG (DUF336 family)